MSELTPLPQVLQLLLSGVEPVDEMESVALRSAVGRVCAEDVTSRLDVPPADNSAMDGYALMLEADQVTAGLELPVSNRIVAGVAGTELETGTAARIFTGANLPRGANTVVKQEDTTQTATGVRIDTDLAKGQNVRPRGQDVRSGGTVVQAGTRLRPQHLGLLASIGCAEVPVRKKLRIAILSTGSELVHPPAALAEGQIYNSNSYVIGGLVQDLGMEVVEAVSVADDLDTTRTILEDAASRSDCVITTGGVSVGDEDYVKTAVEQVGQLDLWRVAIRPGKPLAFGRIGSTPFFGLPGNPVAAFVTFQILARPWLLAKQGCLDSQPVRTTAVSDFDFKAAPVTQYLRVRIEEKDGRSVASIYPNQSAGVLSSLAWANGLAEIEPGREVRCGEGIVVLPV